MTDKQDIGPDEAQNSLDSVDKLQRAGFRRALPPRWLGIGVAFLTASLFALYALEDPYPYIVFPIAGIAILVAIARDRKGAYAKAFPGTNVGRYVLAGICALFIALFFGGIILRRAYDVAWVPLFTGLIVGTTIFILSESERRHYLSKADEVKQG